MEGDGAILALRPAGDFLGLGLGKALGRADARLGQNAADAFKRILALELLVQRTLGARLRCIDLRVGRRKRLLGDTFVGLARLIEAF